MDIAVTKITGLAPQPGQDFVPRDPRRDVPRRVEHDGLDFAVEQGCRKTSRADDDARAQDRRVRFQDGQFGGGDINLQPVRRWPAGQAPPAFQVRGDLRDAALDGNVQLSQRPHADAPVAG